MNFTVNINELREVLSQYSGVEFEVRAYSGRGMYGAQCLAVTFDGGLGDVLAFAQAMQRAEDEGRISDDLQAWIGEGMTIDAREDQLGLGTVLYWPGTEATDLPTGD